MKNSAKSKLSKKLLVFGILTVYLCMATACGTNKGNGNGNGSSMAATPESTVTPSVEKGTSATDNMGDTNGNGNTVSENDSMLDNAGNAVDEAGDTVGNIVDDAANGISDITNDLVGNDNSDFFHDRTFPVSFQEFFQIEDILLDLLAGIGIRHHFSPGKILHYNGIRENI